MTYIDTGSDDGAWANYITEAELRGNLTVLDNKELHIAMLEKKLQKAEKYIAKLEAANRRLSELIADN